MEKKAIYAGSFDPCHIGHIKIITKASKLFDFVYVVVTNNLEKNHSLPLQTRYENLKKKAPLLSNIAYLQNNNQLTALLAKELGCNFLVRSGRNEIDFNYELELAAANNNLNSNLETILIIPDYTDIDYHSRLIKQTIKK